MTGGRPFYPLLAPFPVAFFLGAFVTYLVYWLAPDVMWETFSIWLISAGRRRPNLHGGESRKLTDLPGGPIDHHWTKRLLASPDGSKLFVGVGSNSNITENGIQAEYERAAIWEVDIKSGAHRIFASGGGVTDVSLSHGFVA